MKTQEKEAKTTLHTHAILLKPSDKMLKFADRVQPKNLQKGFTLQELYSLIGCRLVELVRLEAGLCLIVDEEFLLKEHSKETFNSIASAITGQPIFGNAVLCKNEFFQ